MKKVLKSVLGATLAVSMLLGFTACSSSDDKGTKIDVVTPTSPKNKLVIKSNVSATFQLGSTKKTGTEVVFNPTSKGIVTVSAPGRVTKVIEYDFTDTEYQELYVTLESKSKEVAQADAEAGKEVVSNEGLNRTETGVSAAINFNGQKNTNTKVTSPYSITVFTPMNHHTEIEDVTSQSVTLSESVLALDCQPSGAKFDQPITLNLTVPGSKGMKLAVYYEDTKETPKKLTQNGDNISIDIDHFSRYFIEMEGTVTLLKEEAVTYTATANANTGKISIDFEYGYEEPTNTLLVIHFLNKSYVPKAKKTKEYTYPSVEGTATLTMVQAKRTYKLTSGENSYDVVVYGEVESVLTIEHPDGTVIPVPTHNGGSN